MINEIHKLFRKELPDIMTGDEPIKRVLTNEKNHFIYRKENDTLIGVSVINENTIFLLLVDKNHQRQGIGTSLLKESEEYIKSKGFNKVKLGVGSDYIVPGAPMNKNAHLFFEKHGYHHSWGDESCIDLAMSLNDFDIYEHKIGDTIDGILYRIATINDIKGIALCCEEDASNFIEYYSSEDMYDPENSDCVIIAEKDGEILAALMIGIESEEKKIGYGGSIITAPHSRGKGIATNMLKIGTSYMKSIGLETVWLSYTYTAIETIYSKLGYKRCMEYFMGEKEI